MSLDVQVKVDPTNAVSGADKAEKALAETERQGDRVTAAMRRLGQSFQSLDRAMQARARSTQIHNQLNDNLANGFAKVAQAMQHEQKMLDAIRGPMQRYQRDVRALDALMKRGAITANEYNAALARSRAQAGMGNPMDAVSLHRPGQKAANGPGMGSHLRTGAAALGVTLGAQEVLGLADSYTGLENRLRQVATSQSNLNELMSRTREIANNTRSDWKTTGESFVRLSQATKQMGLSQERALKITETLNMALQSSGASASEASAGTLQLMQAMSAGALQGDEFRSIAENIPVLMDVLAKQLGVTRGELKKMGAEGKITTDVMIKALETFGPDARKAFEQTDETFEQFATRMKNNATQIIGSKSIYVDMLNKNTEASRMLRQAQIDETYQATRSKDYVDRLTTSWRALSAAQYAALKNSQQAIDVNTQLVRSMVQLEEMLKIINSLKAKDPWADDRTGWTKLKDRLKARADIIKENFDEQKKQYDRGVKEAQEAADKINRAVMGIIGASQKARAALPGDLDGHTARERAHEGFSIDVGLPDSPSDLDADVAAMQARAKPPGYLTEMWNRELDEATRRGEQFRDDMRDVFQDIGSSMAQALVDGRIEWDRMLKSMTLALIKVAAMGAMRSHGMDTSLLGGIRLPGFATGGSFTVGGNGGTDTTPVAFMATPGERVTVETPGQQAESDSGGTKVINIHLGERDVLRMLDTPEGEKLIVKVMRKAEKRVRGYTTGA